MLLYEKTLVKIICTASTRRTDRAVLTAARSTKVMTRKKKTETRPTDDLREARRKMKVTTAQAVR